MWKLWKFVLPIRRISNNSAALGRDIIKSPSYDSKSKDPDDEVMVRIKSASDSYELLELMSRSSKNDVEPNHLALAFNRLFNLQKSGYNSMNHAKLTNHDGFENICHLLKFKAPRMEVNDLVICLKVINHFGLKSDSITIQRLLHLIKDKINDFSPNQLMFLNFLLSKMDKTPLVEALKIAIPVVFNINLSLKLDHNNTTELIDLLNYASSSRMKISTKSMNNIITALTIHGTNLNLQEARSVIWSMTSLRNIDSSFEKLFYDCMAVLNSNFMNQTFDEVELSLSKIVSCMQAGRIEFYEENFFQNCAKFVVEKNLGYLNASYVLKKFNKINFVSLDLLDYIDKCVMENHSNLSSCKAAGLITLANGFSIANYKSENWEVLKSLLHENPLLHSSRTDMPWIKLSMELMSLDFHSEILLKKIFDSEFLENCLKKPDNLLDLSQMLLLWQALKLLVPGYSGPLPDQKYIDSAIASSKPKINEFFLESLEEAFGGSDCVQTGVATSHGHYLDYVISFDRFDSPIAMPCKILTFDELPKSQVTSVAVFFFTKGCYPINMPQKLRGTFDLRRKTIEALGIKTVNISAYTWNNLPEHEKIAFLEREVRYCLR